MAFFIAEKRRPTPTHLYIMACGDFIKIGVAIDVGTRRNVLQNACPYPITVLRTVLLECFDTAHKHEKALHERFAEQRTYGEWFAITVHEAFDAIALIEPYVPPAAEPKVEAPSYVETDPRLIRIRDALTF